MHTQNFSNLLQAFSLLDHYDNRVMVQLEEEEDAVDLMTDQASKYIISMVPHLKEKEHNASELLEKMEFGQSTLSHHMSLLLDAGVVEFRKQGKWTIYRLNPTAYEKMMDWMKRYLEG